MPEANAYSYTLLKAVFFRYSSRGDILDCVAQTSFTLSLIPRMICTHTVTVDRLMLTTV